MRSYIFTVFMLSILPVLSAHGQVASLEGSVSTSGRPLTYAVVMVEGAGSTGTDSSGHFLVENIPLGNKSITVRAEGFADETLHFDFTEAKRYEQSFELGEIQESIEEVVISATMKEVSRLESPVPVEVYTTKFFKANPTASIFDALQNVNGVRPQVNCNVCNTGDIHINGLEGPYTMILIDGMPIVSGLSTVYGLSGIPQSLIDRVEVVKGPASTLYGSEAVGGLINVITKSPSNAPLFSAETFATSWLEFNADLAAKFRVGRHAHSLLGLNYFNYQYPIDNNKDQFTDLTLQNRVSVFNKWSFDRPGNRVFSIAARYVYEDRWGGDTRWKKEFRGGDSLYGESIYTKRWELFGLYQLPVREPLTFIFSLNGHDQNSVYGTTFYLARQYIGFGQLTWNKTYNAHDILVGAALRYTYYDDNTPATYKDIPDLSGNHPSRIFLPGVFIQDEIAINEQNKLLLGMRYDYNSIHGNIFTPRLNYKLRSEDKSSILRVSVGNGYRVANVFTEDHAALTGSRDVVFIEDLKPERSWNGNVNFVQKFYMNKGHFLSLDATAFYTRFSNRIIADYDTDPHKIIYDNLKGYAISQGISLNADLRLSGGFKALIGGTFMNVYSVENGLRTRQLFTERFTGTWNIGYTIRDIGLAIDYTGNVYSPMRLPLVSESDPRKPYSPWWSIQNIQLSRRWNEKWEVFGGVKNLLDWTPNRGNPFIIARTHDPFDKQVVYDADGQIMATPENPYALTFDPAYVYGPNQGIRFFLGFRYQVQ